MEMLFLSWWLYQWLQIIALLLWSTSTKICMSILCGFLCLPLCVKHLTSKQYSRVNSHAAWVGLNYFRPLWCTILISLGTQTKDGTHFRFFTTRKAFSCFSFGWWAFLLTLSFATTLCGSYTIHSNLQIRTSKYHLQLLSLSHLSLQ